MIRKAKTHAALDKFHRVIMDAALGTDGMDTDNVGMFERCGRASLVLEPLELLIVQHSGQRQDLQRNSAA